MNWYRMPVFERPDSCARVKTTTSVVERRRMILLRCDRRVGAWPAVFRNGHEGVYGALVTPRVAKLLKEVS